MKKRLDQLSGKQQIETLDMLYTAAGAISGRDATKAFLKELLTPSERIMIGRRIWIARLLLSGHTHAEIGKQLEVGPNTIVKVEKWLKQKMPGYRKAIKGLESELDKRTKKQYLYENPLSFRALKKKYPMHFLLFPVGKTNRNQK